jgi:hypothetical protein
MSKREHHLATSTHPSMTTQRSATKFNLAHKSPDTNGYGATRLDLTVRANRRVGVRPLGSYPSLSVTPPTGVPQAGHRPKELIHEQFGDGIMSAINFRLDVRREPDPGGDWVIVTLDGKFLPYQW